MSSLAYDLGFEPAAAPPPVVHAKKPLTLDALRAQIGKIPLVRPGTLPFELPAADGWLGGWPIGAVSEVQGLPGSGRLALLLPILGRLARQGQSIVLVDPGQVFHPPALDPQTAAALLLLRPPPAQAAWAAEQVARSGAVPLVVLLDLGPLGRAGVRLAKAAEAGRTTVVVVSEQSDEDLPAALRVGVSGWSEGGVLNVRCTRTRDGRALGERRLHLRGRTIDLRARPRA